MISYEPVGPVCDGGVQQIKTVFSLVSYIIKEQKEKKRFRLVVYVSAFLSSRLNRIPYTYTGIYCLNARVTVTECLNHPVIKKIRKTRVTIRLRSYFETM